MKSRLAAASVASLALLALSACASGTSDDSDDTLASSFDPDKSYSGSITAMGFGAGDEIATTRMDVAEEALGGAKVKLVEGDLDIQAFLASVASGDAPDLVYANRDQIGTFASRGAILPLSDCIDGEGIDTDQYDDSALSQVTFDDEIYGIPEFNQVQLTQANQKLLDQAGLTVADVDGHDWDAVTAAAKKMYSAPGGKLKIIGYDSKLPEFLPLWAHANGVDILSEDGRTAQLNDPAVVEALTWAVGIYDEQGGFAKVKAYRDSADFFGEGNQFATDVLGAMPMEQWYLNVVNDVSPDAPMAYSTVMDRDNNPIAFSSGSAWAIPKGSPNPGAACRFAKEMTTVDTWKAAAQARLDLRNKDKKPFTGVLTGNDEADAEIQAMTTANEDPWKTGVEAMYAANDHTFALPANPADAEFKTAWQDAVNRVLNGQQDPQEALDQAQDEAQSALDEAWGKWDDE
ncbi:extracellular solute-binding protein [Nocardioides sp. YIM 152315]|uniref:extracellular solute-binding protein n=1 Tax=Nocardioides sp. YIM 152315 TaxID=3031760 RepID=UPI0023DB4F9E|nr:extracellular solute-binding protein [Nocardioides sp. YIM 152315]MDF1605773.1 extracellular solute-binding protein [Nocardioides sp. YIM 152315]